MENLFLASDRARIEERIRGLRDGAARRWGTMDVGRALAHCAVGLEACTGDGPMKQILAGRLLAPLFKKRFLGPAPFSRNAPTGKSLRIAEARDFETERRRVLALVARLVDAGPDAASRYSHGFLGRLTGEEWGRCQWKHLDHHLRQFGA